MTASERVRVAETSKTAWNRPLVGALIAAGTLLFVLANAHFFYVAFSSQPDCVPHFRTGGGPDEAKSFAAASPSC